MNKFDEEPSTSAAYEGTHKVFPTESTKNYSTMTLSYHH